MKNWVLWAMAAGFVAGFVIGLVPDAEAQSRPPRTITVQNTTNNTFTSQWVANTDGGILFDGGVEVGDGMRWHGRAEAMLPDAGIVIAIPTNSVICLNADAGCTQFIGAGVGGQAGTTSAGIATSKFMCGTTGTCDLNFGVGSLNSSPAFFDLYGMTNDRGFVIRGRTGTMSVEGSHMLQIQNPINVPVLNVRYDGAPAPQIADGGAAYRLNDNATITWATDGGVAEPHLNLGGIPAASLPTCNASTAGSIRYDTTNAKHVGCNGSAWTNLY